jgi:CspA family cold shock protein
MTTMHGTVKKYFCERDFGFITRDDGADDLFVHVNHLENADFLLSGRKVSFDVEKSPKSGKLQAVNVHVVD